MLLAAVDKHLILTRNKRRLAYRTAACMAAACNPIQPAFIIKTQLFGLHNLASFLVLVQQRP
jgi:hypothetical protein